MAFGQDKAEVIVELKKGKFTISTDRRKLDLKVIHDFLDSNPIGPRDVSIQTIRRSIRHSVHSNFSRKETVGFARVITDLRRLPGLRMCSCWMHIAAGTFEVADGK